MSRTLNRLAPASLASDRSPTAPATARAPLLAAGGNRALGRWLQARLTVNQPGDAYEVEADRVADRVMRMADPGPVTPLAPTALMRCGCGGSPPGAAPCASCAEEEELHRQADGAGPGLAPPIVHRVLEGPGEPLDAGTRAFMEPRLGADLARVRVHRDGLAAESAGAVRALAYTVGPNVVFGAGQYQPHTASGRRLLAHELTHVLQQGAAPPALRRYEESTEARSRWREAFHEGAAASGGIVGQVVDRAIAARCLTPLEQPMVDITFNRWVPAACARGGAPYLHNRTWDAFGHCWVACEGSRRCGASATADIGTMREIWREFERVSGRRPHDSFRQDVANQARGRALAFTDGTCYSLCDAAFTGGQLDQTAPQGTCIDCATQAEGPCPP